MSRKSRGFGRSRLARVVLVVSDRDDDHPGVRQKPPRVSKTTLHERLSRVYSSVSSAG